MIRLVIAQPCDLDVLTPLANTPAARDALGFGLEELRPDDVAVILSRAVPGTTTRTWSIIAGERIVGCISLSNMNPIQRCGEITNRLVEEAAGWMIGLQAVEQVAAIGFRELNLWRIECTIHGDNRASLLLCDRLARRGLRKEGIRRKAVWREGQWHDSHLYAILREDYKEGHELPAS